MQTLLRLEAIGDDAHEHQRKVLAGLPPEIRPQFKGPHGKPWVAEIVGFDERFGLERKFLRGKKDYRHANSIGSRGVYMCFFLEIGSIYEVYGHSSWRKSFRYFCTPTMSGVQELSEEQVRQCLNARLA